MLPGADGNGLTNPPSGHFEQLKLGIIAPEAIRTDSASKRKQAWKGTAPDWLGRFLQHVAAAADQKIYLVGFSRSAWWSSAMLCNETCSTAIQVEDASLTPKQIDKLLQRGPKP